MAAPPLLGSASDAGSYTLGPQDVIQISVFGAPDLSTLARVSAAGDVVLPLLGTVAVGGLSVSQAVDRVRTRYQQAQLLKNPQIEIFVRDYESQKATVAGAVKTPTVVRMLAPMQLGDVLAAAGGVDPLYGGDEVTITRGAAALGHGLAAKAQLNLRAPETTTMLIYPGDVVQVPQAGIVYVVGAVKQPGGFALAANSNLTVLQALALAQGLGPAAKTSQSVIIRRSETGQHEVPIDLDAVLKRKAPNLSLSANDILYIPRSGPKNLMNRGIDAVVNITSGILIYH